MEVIVVECYSGSEYAETPRALHWEGQRLEVAEVLARWRTPGERHFRLRTRDERVFDLIYSEVDDQWMVESSK